MYVLSGRVYLSVAYVTCNKRWGLSKQPICGINQNKLQRDSVQTTSPTKIQFQIDIEKKIHENPHANNTSTKKYQI